MILAATVLVEEKANCLWRAFRRNLAVMKDATDWKIPKWPFLLGDVLLLGFAYFIVWKSPHPIAKWEIIACFASAATGTLVGIAPFILDYRAMGKVIEMGALGSIAEKIQNLEKLAAQIASATNEWMNAQSLAEKPARAQGDRR